MALFSNIIIERWERGAIQGFGKPQGGIVGILEGCNFVSEGNAVRAFL